MHAQAPMRIPLDGTPAESLFTRQSTEFSCGPATLATVGALYGLKGATYAHFRLAMTPSPETGIHNYHMEETARRLPPFRDMGENAYCGGIAIANILLDGEGHYVVFLCRDGEMLLYHDPFYHAFVYMPEKDVAWTSETGAYSKWAISFAPLPGNTAGKWLALSRPPRRQKTQAATGFPPAPGDSPCLPLRR